MKRQIHLKKAIAVLVGVTLFEAVGVAATTIYMLITDMVHAAQPALVALVLLSLVSVSGSLLAILSVRPILRVDTMLDQTEHSIEDLNHLNNTLRAQRHDFMNHLQVVYTLIELKEFDEAGAYLDKVYSDIQKVSRVLKTGIPAVNAILQAKVQMCESRGITVTIDVRSSLADLAIPAWEFCRVLGNIIDNGMHALLSAESGRDSSSNDMQLTIEIFEDLRRHGFRISNNGPAIPPELWKRIFDAGFTTRGDAGEGMGLTICRELLAECGGTLKVYSNNNLTIFEGFVPRRSDT